MGWMVGALGLGQQAGKPKVVPSICSPEYPCTDNGINHDDAPAPVLACKPSEERCPLGHCQKPARIYPIEYSNEGPTEGAQFVNPAGKLHVCSTCGIVYVPKEKP